MAKEPGFVAVECISIPSLVTVLPGRVRDEQLLQHGQAAITVLVRNTASKPISRAHVSVDGHSAGLTDSTGALSVTEPAANLASVYVYVPESRTLWSQHVAVALEAGFHDTLRLNLASGRLGIPCGIEGSF